MVVSHTRNRSINEPGDSTSVPTLESDSTRVYIDGEVRELKVLSEKGGKFKGKTTGRYNRNCSVLWSHAELHLAISYPDIEARRTIFLTTGIVPTFLIAQFYEYL